MVWRESDLSVVHSWSEGGVEREAGVTVDSGERTVWQQVRSACFLPRCSWGLARRGGLCSLSFSLLFTGQQPVLKCWAWEHTLTPTEGTSAPHQLPASQRKGRRQEIQVWFLSPLTASSLRPGFPKHVLSCSPGAGFWPRDPSLEGLPLRQFSSRL